jgi:pyridoxine/pyridoxamine 5'-phosphate oxidase
MANKNDGQLYVERRSEGDYAVRRPRSERASAVELTQRKAIERAKQLEPNSTPMVERVRKTNVGHPDKWRAP